jgi:hypothetical protein
MKIISNKRSIIVRVTIILLFSTYNQANAAWQSVISAEDTLVKVSSVIQRQRGISGKLDVLWIDSVGFDTLPNRKLVFSFTFGKLDTLTIHGWAVKRGIGRDFYDKPIIRLLKGPPSKWDYGPGTYFGNLVLTKKDVKLIRKALRKGGKSVAFLPKKEGEHVRYEIGISSDAPPLAEKIDAIVATNAIANPSPPKNR